MSVTSFIKDAMGFGIASVVSKAISLATIPFITRALSPSDFGLLELVTGLGALFVVIFSMSLESYLARVWGDLKDVNTGALLLSSLLTFCFCVGAAGITFVCFFILLLDGLQLYDRSFDSAIILISVNSLFAALSGLVLMVLRMNRTVGKFVIVIAIQSLSLLCFILILQANRQISIDTVVASTVLSTLASFVTGLIFVRQYVAFGECRLSVVLPALRFGMPLMPAVGVTWATSQVDRYALLYYVGVESVAEYAILTKVAAFLLMAIAVFRQAWLPYAYELARRPDRGAAQFTKVLEFYFLAGLVMSLAVVLMADVLVNLFAPSSYEVSVSALPIILLSAVIYGSSAILSVGTMVSGKTEWNSYAAVGGLFINIILASVLIPQFQMAGAAWGGAMSAAVFCIVLSWRSHQEINLKLNLLKPLILICCYLTIALQIA